MLHLNQGSMNGRNRVMFIFLLALLSQINRNGASTSNSTFVKTFCVGDFNNTKNGTYEQNLNHLLSALAPHASVVKFYNLTTGEDPNKVYGLFQCRQDLSLDVCSQCIHDATQQIVADCSSKGEAIAWYYECTLRYSNRNIFARMEMVPSLTTWSTTNASNMSTFITKLGDTMDGVIKDAADITPSGHFATKEANLSFPEKLYCLAQCTSDISKFDCNFCLRNALALTNTYCANCTNGINFSPSCQLWYALSPFNSKVTPDPNAADNAPPSPAPENEPRPSHTGNKSNKSTIVAIVVGAAAVILLLIAGILVCMRRAKAKELEELPTATSREASKEAQENGEVGDADFLQYDFATLNTATRDFSGENMLGEGDSSDVYKGVLKSGEIVAIKRLPGMSGQDRTEFMTKARKMAQLQHRNIVKLIGFCSEGYEELLVFEFVPNKSLGNILFDPRKRALLEWETRHKIITGIARGLQYLHEDSRFMIIHRDLKPSNILLDLDMNARIAEFDIAKLFGWEQYVKTASRSMVGTYGYMAPEYVLQGEYSDKSDLYSFGIIILEIVSGQKNQDYYHAPQKEDLLLFSWKLWKAGQALDIMDPILLNNCSTDEVMRCIQIGLLCVQADPLNRPAIGKVVRMLNGLLELPTPSSPAIPSVDLILPLNDDVGGWKNDTEQSNVKSVTWKVEEVEHDLYPRE